MQNRKRSTSNSVPCSTNNLKIIKAKRRFTQFYLLLFIQLQLVQNSMRDEVNNFRRTNIVRLLRRFSGIARTNGIKECARMPVCNCKPHYIYSSHAWKLNTQKIAYMRVACINIYANSFPQRVDRCVSHAKLEAWICLEYIRIFTFWF